MKSGLKFRVALFIAGITVLVAALFWIAQSSWRRINELRERLTSVELESFIIAEHFQKSILELNGILIRYEIDGDKEVWTTFLNKSRDLNLWIDEQTEKCRTGTERGLVRQLDGAYDTYLQAARAMQSTNTAVTSPTETLKEYAKVKFESDNLLKLGIQLASAHRDSLQSFLAESNTSLLHLRIALLSSLGMLVLFGAGLATVIFRDMIAPLRVKLVESQALLERQEKLASLGVLAAGVAHEIRNPLTAIKARLFTQMKMLKPGTPEQTDAQVIGGEINRLERIVKDFLQFARPGEPELAGLTVGDVLGEAVELLTPQLVEKSIQVSIQATEQALAASLRADRQQLKQVLINLIQNAADSFGEKGGSIQLRARLDHLSLLGQNRPVIVLEVSDNGKGIPPDVEKRLFDPFFTTKDTGTGLGLSIAARIVEKHGGALQYQTQVGRGTTFGIVLPRVEPA
jgi:signal transduction histidine kinase